tara:strand:- start:2018 stop:5905 length:3888 start_codon:yes stop_codon:yes gene_type:complete
MPSQSSLVTVVDNGLTVVDPDLISGGLRSKQFATVVDLLGYGEIDSILDGGGTDGFLKNIFFNRTPLKNANGDDNFEDVEVSFKNGASNQSPSILVPSTETEIPINLPVTKETSRTGTITNESVDRVRVSIEFPRLFKINDKGDRKGHKVKISIRITENDGTTHNPVVEDEINGKAFEPYIKDYEIQFLKSMSFPVSITVIRNSNDTTSSKKFDKTIFKSFTEIVTNSNAFQGFAYVAVRFNAQSLQSFPERMYRIKGTKIKVPHGTTVDSDNGRVIYPEGYTFNGTFKTDKEWCSDPAWVLYDLLTTDKGFGGSDGIIDEDTLDVFSFYSASAYASELITDPITETTEPRFSTNIIIQRKNDAYSVINDLCSVMNAMPFYSLGSLKIGQDRPTNTDTNTSEPEYIFTNANVTQEGFSYKGVGQKTKFTEVEVSYFDNDTQTIEIEYVDTNQITALSGYIAKYGRTRKTLKAFACTSRGQANRVGRWFLYTNLKESEVCAFQTTLEAGVIVRPSMIIGIADSLKAGIRRGGRINSVNDSAGDGNIDQIIVDDINNTDFALDDDGNPTGNASITVIMPDGSAQNRLIQQVTGSTITVTSPFSTSPNKNTIYAIENTNVEFQTYRVMSIEEVNTAEYKITAIIHDANKYAQVEDTTIAANPRSITTLLDDKPSPQNLGAVEEIVEFNNRAVSRIFVSWQPVQGVKEYLVEFQFEDENPQAIKVPKPEFEIFESEAGNYKFSVKSYNAIGKLGTTTSELPFVANGKIALPKDPTGLTVEPVSDGFIKLRFDPSTDIDVTHGGSISVRHTTDTTAAANFANSLLIDQLAGNVTEAIVPAMTGTYSIKFVDDGFRRSKNAAKILITKPDAQPNQIVVSRREDQSSPKFNGERVRTVFSSEFNGLVLDGTDFFDNVPDVDALAKWDFGSSGIASRGFYTFPDDLDLGSVFNLSLERHFKTAGIVISDLWNARVQLVDNMTDWDGTLAENVSAKLQVATCQGVPTSSLSVTYSQVQDLITINRNAHDSVVGDNVLVDFTTGGLVDEDGFLKVVSTTTSAFVVEAKRNIAEYEIVNEVTGEIRIFTDGTHGGLVVNDTVKLVFTSGEAVSGDYIVGATQALGVLSITTSDNEVTKGTVEFIKIKDNSGNNVTTSGNANVSSSYSPFNTFLNGEFRARGFRFRAEITSDDPDENIEIDELGYTASMIRRFETVNSAIDSDCSTNNAAKTVTFINPFFTGTSALNSSTTAFLPTIGITLEGAVSGDYFKITSVTGTQFVIETKDASNNFKDLSFKYTAIGFGKGT